MNGVTDFSNRSTCSLMMVFSVRVRATFMNLAQVFTTLLHGDETYTMFHSILIITFHNFLNFISVFIFRFT